MPRDTQFEKLADKTHLTYYQDGMLDAFFGSILVAVGVGEATHWTNWLTTIFVLFGYLILPLRKRIVTPRLGYVEFLPTRAKEFLLRVVYPLFWILGMGAILVFYAPMYAPKEVWEAGFLTSAQHWLQANWALLIGVMATSGLGLLGWGLRIHRFYAYGLLSLALMIGCRLSGLPTHIYLWTVGGVLFATGLVMLVRFLHRYPILAEEEVNRAAQ